ncbi:hypothetical protein TNCV_3246121 [Trichonephila clavipes]|nr:hypothetical protein TNCV_3246121 [Trichonephila clavipes]
MASAENAISAINQFAFPDKILIMELVIPYILKRWISKNAPANEGQHYVKLISKSSAIKEPLNIKLGEAWKFGYWGANSGRQFACSPRVASELLFQIPSVQESLHQVLLTFPHKNVCHKPDIVLQTTIPGKCSAVQKMGRRSRDSSVLWDMEQHKG